MLREDDTIRLRHMLDAANEAIEHFTGRKRQDLDSDRQLVHSLVRCVEIIGEAAGKVSDKCREDCPQIPWRRIVGMRNRLIHAYFDVNLNILWRTADEELPPLVTELQRVLQP